MKRLAWLSYLLQKLFATGTQKLNKRNEKRKLLRSLLFSYCILTAIPIIVGVTNYSYMSDVLYQEAVNAQQLVLANGMNSLEISFDNIDQTVQQLGNDSRIAMLLNQKNTRAPQNVMTLRAVSNSLPVIYNDYELISSYFIYCRQSGTMLSSNQVFFDVDTFYDTHFRLGNLTLEEWKQEVLEKVHYRTLLPVSNVAYKMKAASFLLYLQEIYSDQSGNVSGLVITYISEKAIHSIMADAEQVNASFTCLLDQSGRMLTSISFEDIDLEQTTLHTGEYSGEVSIDGDAYVVNALYSQDFGFSYVIGVKKADVLNNAMPILHNMLLHVAIMLGAGIIFACVLGYININPLVQIMHKLLPQENTANSQISYYKLYEELTQLIDKRDALERRVDSQDVLLQEVIFSQIINGEITDEAEIRSLLQHVQIELHGEWFRGVLLSTDVDSNAVRGLLSAHLRSCPQLPFCYCTNKMLLLYEENDSYNCEIFFRDLANELEDAYSVHVTFYVGSVQTLGEMNQSFAAARSLANYQQESVLPVVIWDSPQVNVQKTHTYSQNDERKLTSMVEQGNFSGIRILLEDIYERHFINSLLSTNTLQQLIARLLDTLQRLAGTENADVPTLKKCLSSSPRYVFDRILSSYQILCEISLDRRQTKTERLAEDIHAYIEKNYSRSDLDLQTVIDHFGISLSHGSRMIKNHLGETFSTILLQIRIDKANELLKSSSLSIQRIAEVVGYDNQNSFRRAYKRAMGISPSEYRTGIPDSLSDS